MRREVPLGVQVVEPEDERVVLVQVVVELEQDLVVVGLVGVALVGSGDVPVVVEQHLADRVHGGGGHPGLTERDVAVLVRHEVAAGIVGPLQLAVQEEEQLVPQDRPAEREPGLHEALVGIRHHLRTLDLVPLQRVGPEEAVRRAPPVVRPAPRHRVHVRPGEPALPDVERGDGHLHLLDGVVRDRLRLRLAPGQRVVEAEGVVEVGPVHREVVVEPVPSREGEVAVAPRVELGQVPDAPLDRRRQRDLHRAEVRLRAGAAGVEHRVLGRDLQFLELHRPPHEREVGPERLAQLEEHVPLDALLHPDERDRDGVRPADAQVRQVVRPARSRDGAVARAGRHVHRHDRGLGERGALGVRHPAVDRGRRDALGGQRDGEDRDEREDEEQRECTSGEAHGGLLVAARWGRGTGPGEEREIQGVGALHYGRRDRRQEGEPPGGVRRRRGRPPRGARDPPGIRARHRRRWRRGRPPPRGRPRPTPPRSPRPRPRSRHPAGWPRPGRAPRPGCPGRTAGSRTRPSARSRAPCRRPGSAR